MDNVTEKVLGYAKLVAEDARVVLDGEIITVSLLDGEVYLSYSRTRNLYWAETKFQGGNGGSLKEAYLAIANFLDRREEEMKERIKVCTKKMNGFREVAARARLAI